MPLLPEAKNCDPSVKKNFRRISRELGYAATPAWKSITLTDLVASRLVATDSGKVFESVTDLTNWIEGTTNQVIVTVLAGGKVTLSTPQDIHVDATPEFAGLSIKDSSDNLIFYVDNDEMYFTGGAVEIGGGIMAAADMMVTVAGAGNNDGSTWANAMAMADWLTDMTDNAEAGDRYFVEEGTYTLAGAFDCSARDGSITVPIHIIGVLSGTTNEPPVFSDHAFGANRPVIAAGANTLIFGDYWFINNVDVTTTEALGLSVGIGSVLHNCKSYNSSGTAWRRAFRFSAGCNIVGCDGQSDAGFAFDGGATCLTGCYAHDSAIGFNATAYLIILNSIADTCTTYGISINSRSGSKILNNTIYNCATGIYGTTAGYCMVLNNIIDACTKGVEWTTQTHSNRFDFNCWDNTDDVVDTDIVQGNSKVTGDPGMTNPGAGDFSIGTGSNCHNVALDAGDLTGATV